MESDLQLVVRGKLIVFRVQKINGYKGSRVLCPECSNIVDRGKARRHFTRNHDGEVKNGSADREKTNDVPQSDEASGASGTEEQSEIVIQIEKPTPSPERQQSEDTDDTVEKEGEIVGQNGVSISRKRRQDDEDHAIWKRLCGEVPTSILESTMAAMPASAYEVSGHGLILPPSTLTFLQGILPRGYTLSKLNLSKAGSKLVTKDDVLATFDDLSSLHLLALEAGGIVGLERIVGAILATGSHQFKVLCVEAYSRDRLEDPHAESHSAAPASIPTDGATTQYKGKLKIVHINGEFSNKKLVIGVRSHDYLVTSGLYNGKSLVGPGRCSEFPVNQATKIYLRKEKQDVALLEGDILGLAQVRTHFGHTATYSTRRAALRGYGSIPLMPITVFTLSQFEVKHSRVFRELAVRSMKKKKSKVCLYLKDLDEPQETNAAEVAKITRQLMSLLSEDRKLVITGNPPAEKLLSELANAFSRRVSSSLE